MRPLEQSYRFGHDAEYSFRTFVDFAADAYIVHDEDEAIVDANRRACEILGYDRDQLIGKTRFDIDADLDESTVKGLNESLKKGEFLTIETRYRRADGTVFPVEVRLRRFQDGGRTLSLSMVRDVTVRKQAEAALRESEERFRTLVQFSFDVYWESDAQHRFTRQEFAESVVDAPTRGSELGKTRWEVPYLEPDAEAWRKHRETLDAHLPFRDFELARPMPDGSKRYVSVSGMPVFDDDGRFVGYRGVGRHITERKQAEQALREAQAELAHVNRVTTMGQLAASIAHELNQPIGAAVINAQAALRLLSANPPDLEEVRQALSQIVESGRRAGEVMSRVRALVKKTPPRGSRFDLNEAILDVIALTRSEMLKHGVALRTDLAAGLPSLDGDRVQLQQVILNLLMNAAEAMSDLGEETRELLISTQTDVAGGVLVAVRDSGPGLDAASAHRVFEAFYTTKPEGLGMGLAICRSIIEAHGGRLWASANEPRGAVFQFTLPPRQKTAPARQADGTPVG